MQLYAINILNTPFFNNYLQKKKKIKGLILIQKNNILF